MTKYITTGSHHFKVAANKRLILNIWHHRSTKQPLSCRIDLTGAGAAAEVYYCFTGCQDDELTADISLNHLQADTTAKVTAKGALRDRAKQTFTSLIYIAPQATHSESFLEHRTILLSEKARVETTPALEILTDEVKASHAATVSRFDREQLIYAQSRGLPPQAVETILLESFLAGVIGNFPTTKRSAIIKKLS